MASRAIRTQLDVRKSQAVFQQKEMEEMDIALEEVRDFISETEERGAIFCKGKMKSTGSPCLRNTFSDKIYRFQECEYCATHLKNSPGPGINPNSSGVELLPKGYDSTQNSRSSTPKSATTPVATTPQRSPPSHRRDSISSQSSLPEPATVVTPQTIDVTKTVDITPARPKKLLHDDSEDDDVDYAPVEYVKDLTVDDFRDIVDTVRCEVFDYINNKSKKQKILLSELGDAIGEHLYDVKNVLSDLEAQIIDLKDIIPPVVNFLPDFKKPASPAPVPSAPVIDVDKLPTVEEPQTSTTSTRSYSSTTNYIVNVNQPPEEVEEEISPEEQKKRIQDFQAAKAQSKPKSRWW